MIRKTHYISLVSISLMFLFAYAMVSKAIDLDKFRTQIGQSVLLSNFVGFVIWFVLMSELIVIALLWVKSCRIIGLYLSYFLMILFSAYIFCVSRFSKDVPCSCGGVLENMSWDNHLIFNLSITLLIVIGIFLDDHGR